MSKHWTNTNKNDFTGSINEYFVDVCGFSFRFRSLDHLRLTIAFYEQKVLPPSRLPDMAMRDSWREKKIINAEQGFSRWLSIEHRSAQRPFERLPLYLRENGKRERVLKVLPCALKDWQ